MTTSQKRKAFEKLASDEFESVEAENNTVENPIDGRSKSPKMQHGNLDKIKTSLTKEIMPDLTKIPAENQKETLKLLLSNAKKHLSIKI